MNPFSLKNFKNYGLPLLISFLGFFIGYTQKTNAELEGIHQEQTKITNQVENYATILQRIEEKIDSLAIKVDVNEVDIAKCKEDIDKINIRMDFLEGKGARYKQ